MIAKIVLVVALSASGLGGNWLLAACDPDEPPASGGDSSCTNPFTGKPCAGGGGGGNAPAPEPARPALAPCPKQPRILPGFAVVKEVIQCAGVFGIEQQLVRVKPGKNGNSSRGEVWLSDAARTCDPGDTWAQTSSYGCA